MLRGLDSGGREEDPVVVKVADRTALDGSVTTYLRTGVSSVVRERQARVRETVETVAEAGIVEDLDVVGWPERVRAPPDTDVGAEALQLYDEFIDAVAAEPLVPFFEARPGAGGADRVVDLPAICVAYRVDGDLAGLYPRWREGEHHSIEDCMRALSTGAPLENVRRA